VGQLTPERRGAEIPRGNAEALRRAADDARRNAALTRGKMTGEFVAVVGKRTRRRPPARVLSLVFFGAIALAFINFYTPPSDLFAARFGHNVSVAGIPGVQPSANAFGTSGEVSTRFALPDEPVEYPLEVNGDPSELVYQWVRAVTGDPVGVARPLLGSRLVAPPQPGFYQLTLLRGSERRNVGAPALAVLVPFSDKAGTALNGYKIGTYLAERVGGSGRERPDGFIEIAELDIDMPLTRHFKVGDFLTRDNQKSWPRYAAVEPELLDKLELVMAEIRRMRGGDTAEVTVDVVVSSGYRTPHYNGLMRFANQSRHLQGDAADLAIDADGDGRFTVADTRLVALAVEAVEREHPHLVGGFGVYTSRKYRHPYVHIDTRGKRARWRG
jgi:uncharacterized protein YcbK (DUF882 family)